MASLNKVMLIGTLGKDPERRSTQGGKVVCSLSVATNERYTDRGGQKQEKTDWHRLVAWGKTAELICEYLHKGAMAYFEGKLSTRSYEDRSGNKQYMTEVVVSQVVFLGGAKRQREQSEPSGNWDMENNYQW